MPSSEHRNADSRVIGRYAPSPTGALHLSNLRTALVAWLHARLQSGQFLLRMEDLDRPRVVPGSDAHIIQDLEWLGIDWDGEVIVQSARLDSYTQAMQRLRSHDLAYPCFCSRKDIREAASAPHQLSGIYPGTCRALSEESRAQQSTLKTPSWRFRAHLIDPSLDDCVVQRADGVFSYHLAVVVDDLAQGITQVVRGADLSPCESLQQALAAHLAPDRAPIVYRHVPLVTDAEGKRLSKRDGSESAQVWRAAGRSSEQLVARFAQELGLIDVDCDALSAHDLLDTLSFERLEAVLA